jgi:hypothetical protein
MQQNDVIKAIEAHAADFNLEASTIGQMAVHNRHAVDRIKTGTASIATMQRVMEFLQSDRAVREASKAGAA